MCPRSDYSILTGNPVLQSKLESIYARFCISYSWSPDRPVILVVKQPVAECWADGMLVLGEPILASLTDEAMVAALIAHLITHVVYGHQSSEMEYRIPKSVLMIPRADGFFEDPTVENVYLSIVRKPEYTESWELETHESAMLELTLNGYDPAGVVDLALVLERSKDPMIREFGRRHCFKYEKEQESLVRISDLIRIPPAGFHRGVEDWQNAWAGKAFVPVPPLEP